MEGGGCMSGVCLVASFDVRMSCSIPSFQLAHALLIRRLASGVRGISVFLFDSDTVVLCVAYSSVVSESKAARCWVS